MSKLINVASFKYRADPQSPWQKLVLTGDVSALSDIVSDIVGLKTSIIQSGKKAINSNGTKNFTVAGLTADHVVANWGMFTDSGLTTPIPENAPTCDIELTTGNGTWTAVISNFTSSFYMKPTFIKD